MKKGILITVVAVLILSASCDADFIMGIGNRMSLMGEPVVDVNLPVIENSKKDIADVCSSDFDATENEAKINSLVDNIAAASANPDAEKAVKEALSKRAESVPAKMENEELVDTIKSASDSLSDLVNTVSEDDVPQEVQDQVLEIIAVVKDIFGEEKTVSDVVSFHLIDSAISDVASFFEIDKNDNDYYDQIRSKTKEEVEDDFENFFDSPEIESAIEKLSTVLYINDSSIELASFISLII